MKNTIYIILILVLLNSLPARAQENYYSYTNENFRSAQIFKETVDTKHPDLLKINAILFYLTNEIRIKKKLNSLEYQSLLEKSSMLHSDSMVNQKFFDHVNPRYKILKTPEDRARYAGISNPHIAENIAEAFLLQYKSNSEVFILGKGIFSKTQGGPPIPAHTYLSLGEKILDDWMNSPKHRDNILDSKALQLGCGTAFFLKKDFNDMPSILATQNFQLYENILRSK